MYFNPRPSHRGRREVSFAFTVFIKFQSTSPARGTTAKRIPRFFWRLDFNPRPPHGGRQNLLRVVSCLSIFQSTSPAWGTTSNEVRLSPCSSYFNPRPPHGGRLTNFCNKIKLRFISIHVPRAGDDINVSQLPKITGLFQSTSPVRGTTSILLTACQ